MRKVRDYDAELRALNDKAKALKARKVQQIGELVTSTGADALDLDTLAGGLLAAVEAADANEKEAWCSWGVAFFQGLGRKAGRCTGGNGTGARQKCSGPEQAWSGQDTQQYGTFTWGPASLKARRQVKRGGG